MSLRFARFKITGIVTNYPRPRTFGAGRALAPKKRPGATEALKAHLDVLELRLERHRYRPCLRPRSAADFADLEAHKAPDRDVFAELGYRLRNHLADSHALVLDVVLFVEAIFLIELFHFSVDDFLDDRLRLARRQRLRFVNVALLLEHLRR